MRTKTSDLVHRALDWAVAKAEGRLGATVRDETRPGTSIIDIDFDEFGELVAYMPARRGDPYIPYAPSTDPAQGWPIIDRERITLRVSTMPGTNWAAFYDVPGEYHAHVREKGPTGLVAAMRCFVAKRLGNEVDVPEELLQ